MVIYISSYILFISWEWDVKEILRKSSLSFHKILPLSLVWRWIMRSWIYISKGTTNQGVERKKGWHQSKFSLINIIFVSSCNKRDLLFTSSILMFFFVSKHKVKFSPIAISPSIHFRKVSAVNFVWVRLGTGENQHRSSPPTTPPPLPS